MISRRCVLGQASALAGAGWPSFRGAGDSLTDGRQLPLTWSAETWSATTPGYGQSSPVVFGKRVFITAVEGAGKETLYVLCLDLKSGRELWRRTFAATQRTKNSETTSRAAPTPCVDGRRLYVFFESGDLLALDHDGRTLWTRKLTEEYGLFQGNHGIGGSPVLTSMGLAVLVSHGGPCYLLLADKATGENVWRTERETKAAWTTPNVLRRAGREQIVVSVNGRVESYDGADGRSLWHLDGFKGNLLSSATVAEDLLIVGSSEKGNVAAIAMPDRDGEEARLAWRAENASSYFGSPLVHRGQIWMAGKVGVGWCLDLRSGKELWHTRLAAECWASPIGAGERVYFFTVKGVTEVFRAGAAEPEKLAANSLEDMERTYGVAAVERGFVMRSGRRAVRV